MREYTMEQLLEWYEEALAEYESAIDNYTFDDEEHDKIAVLFNEVEELEEEINRRKGEQE